MAGDTGVPGEHLLMSRSAGVYSNLFGLKELATITQLPQTLSD